MKKSTYEKRAKIANDVMNYIYKYIDTNINIDELSCELHISKFHLHRVFKEEFGKNIYESITIFLPTNTYPCIVAQPRRISVNKVSLKSSVSPGETFFRNLTLSIFKKYVE